jgi:hypothetical protein
MGRGHDLRFDMFLGLALLFELAEFLSLRNTKVSRLDCGCKTSAPTRKGGGREEAKAKRLEPV